MCPILLVEDEPKLAHSVQKGLEEHGYCVIWEPDGSAGLEKALSTSFSLVILDIMLPGTNGWDILSCMREKKVEIPILFLTALDGVEERVKGLQLGADDYLVKPFAFSELLARVEAILRRTKKTHRLELFQLEDLNVSFAKHKVTRSGQDIDLTTKELAILRLLAENLGNVISRKTLLENVWGFTFDCETNVIDVSIRRLRQKIDDPYPVKLIHTVRGVGYVLQARFGQ